eukprot:COSAG02_NODE_5484_length_4288_cov_15.095727_2_plen_597_part_00
MGGGGEGGGSDKNSRSQSRFEDRVHRMGHGDVVVRLPCRSISYRSSGEPFARGSLEYDCLLPAAIGAIGATRQQLGRSSLDAHAGGAAASTATSGEELSATSVQTPQLEPEPEPSQEDGVVEIIVPGELVAAENPADLSAMAIEIKAAIVAALWSEIENVDVLPAGDVLTQGGRGLTVTLRNCQEAPVAATLVQRVACDVLDVQLCRQETSANQIRVIVVGLPAWAAAALASIALGGGVHQQSVGLGSADPALPALTHRIQVILQSESARCRNVCFTKHIEVTIDGLAVTVDAPVAVQEDTSIGRPRSTASAASIEEPDEKRLRSTATAVAESVSASTSTEMCSSGAAGAIGTGELHATRSDESMRDESDTGGAGGDSNGGTGTETESQSGSESESEEEGALADNGAQIHSARQDRMTAPVVKLSVKLIETYNHINEVYYSQQKEKKKWDDKNSDYIVKSGDLIGNGRYRLKKVIGSGSFGQVVSAIDTKLPGLCDACALPEDTKGPLPGLPSYPHHPTGRCEVAIKIIKNKPAFHRQAKVEIELLALLNSLQQSNSRFDPNLVRMLAHFIHRDHNWCALHCLLSCRMSSGYNCSL